MADGTEDFREAAVVEAVVGKREIERRGTFNLLTGFIPIQTESRRELCIGAAN